MDTNLKLETPPTEGEARAAYSAAVSAFDKQANTVDALRAELEEEVATLDRLHQDVNAKAGAFLRAVERDALDVGTRADDTKDKAESRTIGKIMGKTEDAPSAPPVALVDDEPAFAASEDEEMFLRSGTRPDVTEADRDETAIAAEDDKEQLSILSPGARRAENIAELSPEREAEAEDVLKTVDNILSKD